MASCTPDQGWLWQAYKGMQNITKPAIILQGKCFAKVASASQAKAGES